MPAQSDLAAEDASGPCQLAAAPSLTAFSAAPREHHVAVDADIGTGGEDKPLTRPIRGPDLISSPKKMISIVFRGRRPGLFLGTVGLKAPPPCTGDLPDHLDATSSPAIIRSPTGSV
jgi:hypothetical protein